MRREALVTGTLRSLALNLAFGLAHCVLGIWLDAWWFITLGVYYTILGAARVAVLQVRRRAAGDLQLERFAKKITGILLLALSVCLVGVVILSVAEERGVQFHTIIMIAVALYAFSKVGGALWGLIAAGRTASPVAKTLRNLSFADALVSIFSLQRSMLVSFPGLTPAEIAMFNALTGFGVCLLVCLLGINLIGGRYVEMAKSKLVRANEKVAETVVGGYKKVENAVVDGYKKVENAAVSGYTKLEDRFVDAYLTKDGETVEEAKARLKHQNK